jgi:hypothetical protein
MIWQLLGIVMMAIVLLSNYKPWQVALIVVGVILIAESLNS